MSDNNANKVADFVFAPILFLLRALGLVAVVIAAVFWHMVVALYHSDTADVLGVGPYRETVLAAALPKYNAWGWDGDAERIQVDFGHRRRLLSEPGSPSPVKPPASPHKIGDLEVPVWEPEPPLTYPLIPTRDGVDVLPVAGGVSAWFFGDGAYGELPNFCLDKAAAYWPSLDTSAPEGRLARKVSIQRRKSARIYTAYTNAGIMVSFLRVTLAMLKLGESLNSLDYGPMVDTMTRDHKRYSPCAADPMDPRTTDGAAYRRWQVASFSIKLTHAPVVQVVVRYRKNRYVPAVLTGVCLANECDEDDLGMFYGGPADWQDPVPPLSPAQLRAVSALNATSTEDFWLLAAHENGIFDDAQVLYMLDKARYFRNMRLGWSSVSQQPAELEIQ